LQTVAAVTTIPVRSHMSHEPKRAPSSNPRPDTRKPYHEPVLTEYGSISKLTRGASGSGSEGAGAMKMACL
jgi:hypothetical protein